MYSIFWESLGMPWVMSKQLINTNVFFFIFNTLSNIFCPGKLNQRSILLPNSARQRSIQLLGNFQIEEADDIDVGNVLNS